MIRCSLKQAKFFARIFLTSDEMTFDIKEHEPVAPGKPHGS